MRTRQAKATWKPTGWPVLFWPLLVAACGHEERSPDVFVDTAAASTVEEVRIDGLTLDLVRVSDLAVARDGSIALGQPQDHTIRYFDPYGHPVATFGRSGAGPGEFESLQGLGWLGDTLWVWDSGLKRTTLLGPDRSLLRTLSMPANVQSTNEALRNSFSFELAGVLDDGTLLATAYAIGYTAVVRLSPDGAALREVIRGSSVEEAHRFAIGSTVLSVDPFPARTLTDVSPDGQRIAVVRTHLQGQDGNSLQVTVVGANADTVFTRSYSFAGVEIPQSVRDSILQAASERLAPELAAAYRSHVYFPPAYPPVSDVVLGTDQTVWLGIRETSQKRRYLVLETSGEPLAIVELPSRTSVRAASRAWLWCVELDEYDVNNVVKYRIELRKTDRQ